MPWPRLPQAKVHEDADDAPSKTPAPEFGGSERFPVCHLSKEHLQMRKANVSDTPQEAETRKQAGGRVCLLRLPAASAVPGRRQAQSLKRPSMHCCERWNSRRNIGIAHTVTNKVLQTFGEKIHGQWCAWLYLLAVWLYCIQSQQSLKKSFWMTTFYWITGLIAFDVLRHCYLYYLDFVYSLYYLY